MYLPKTLSELSDEELGHKINLEIDAPFDTTQEQGAIAQKATLYHSEFTRRQTNKSAFWAKLLIITSIVLTLVNITFATLDYLGDKSWQSQQIKMLENIEVNTKESRPK